MADELISAKCVQCGNAIYWQDCPTGGWWIHCIHPADNHDAWSATGDPE